LLLDEPLSNLDARLRLEMRTEIRRVCKEYGLTAIYVTHDQKEALSVSDRMAILDGGTIAQVGTPEQIYRRPHTKVVADFIGETNFLPGRVEAVSAEGVEVETAWGRFRGVCGDALWRPQPGGHVVLSIRPECWRFSSDECGVNAVKGTIGYATYLGEVSQYRVALAGADLKIFELNPHPSARPPGQELQAVVEKDDVVVIKP
jgi:iron(III) transport system ATP-binding protein